MSPTPRKKIVRRAGAGRQAGEPTVRTLKRARNPDWMGDLKGGDTVSIKEGPGPHRDMAVGEGEEPPPEEMWRVQIQLPKDLAALSSDIDPLIIAAGVKEAVDDLEEKLTELVRLARTQGHTWTKIGEALGTSKQAAWERFSGED